MLTNGISNALKVSMCVGGHTPPVYAARPIISSLPAPPGNRLASKKAQKKATKNITSEAMNNAMP